MPLKSDLMLGKRAVAQDLVSQANLQVILEEQRHLEGQGEYRPLGEFLVSMLGLDDAVLERLRAEMERDACAQLATHVGRQLVAEKLTNDVALRSAMRGFKRDPAARPSGLLQYLSTIGGLVESSSGVTAAQVDAVTTSYLAVVGYGTLMMPGDDEDQQLRIGYQRGMIDEGKVYFCVWCRIRGIGTSSSRLEQTLGDDQLEQVEAIRRRIAGTNAPGPQPRLPSADEGTSASSAVSKTPAAAVPAPAARPTSQPTAASTSNSSAAERPTVADSRPPSKPLAVVERSGASAARSAPPRRAPVPVAEPLGSIDDSSEGLEVPDQLGGTFEASSAEWITFDPPADGSIATVILPVSLRGDTEALDPPAPVPSSPPKPPVGPSGRDVFVGEHDKETFRESAGRPAAPPRSEARPSTTRGPEPRQAAARVEDRAPSPRPEDHRSSPSPPNRSPRRETTRKNRVKRKEPGRSIDPMWLAGGGLFCAALVLLAVVIAMRDAPPQQPPRPGGGSAGSSGTVGGGSGSGSSITPDQSAELVARHAQAREQIERQLAAGLFEEARRIAVQFAAAIEEAGLTGEVWDDRRTELELMISRHEMDRYNQLVSQFETAVTELQLDVAEKALAELAQIVPATERDQLKVLQDRLRDAKRGGGSGPR